MRRHVSKLVFLIALHGFLSGASAQIPSVGPNVNMLSGTTWPNGDPFLQRQNEPSIAVSSRNPQHLVAGSNDYRTVDLSLATTRVVGDAWLGLYKSFDGGQTWRSTLLPGCPYPVPECQGSVIGGLYQAGADPVVRAGTNGMFFYSAIAFDRDNNRSAYFISRLIDDNNRERIVDDTIRYLDTAIVDRGNSGQFVDKPWIAVDVPRPGAAMCSIPSSGDVITPPFPAGNVYAAYSKFTGVDDRAKVFFSRSTDCGLHWSNPIKLSEGTAAAQGASIAVDPLTGAVYVAWRRFKQDTTQLDSILVVKSTDGGQHFAQVNTVANIIGFDADTTEYSFRVLSFPTITVDASGRVYIAWSARQTAFGEARVMLSTSTNGTSWTPSTMVEPPPPLWDMSLATPAQIQPGLGHQLMPSLSVSSGKVAVLYYSLYEDSTKGVKACPYGFLCNTIAQFMEFRKAAGTFLPFPPVPTSAQLGTVFGPYVQDLTPSGFPPLTRRHTMDVRVAMGDVGVSPSFSSTRVSQYPFGSPSTDLGALKPIQQLRENPPNLPLFVQGTKAFMGDYIDLNGQTGLPGAGPTFVAAWTDNRDIRPPADGNWQNYTPVITPTIGPASSCVVGQAGMRNQNVYFARITGGLSASALGNSKQLTTTFQRGFSIVVQNNTDQTRSYRLTIANQPVGGTASFLQTSLLTILDVSAAPRSSFSRTVFATSTNPDASITVNVAEITAPGGGFVPGGQQSVVLLNPDLTNPDLTNPDLTNPSIQTAELYVPDLTNPDLTNPDLTNPDLTNPDLTNPDLTNPDLTNPDLTNIGISTPDLTNPDLTNPDLTNPDLTNADISTGSLTDVTWKITNKGNTTATFAIRLVTPLGQASVPAGFKTQLILHKTYATPAASTTTCQLIELNQNILVANIINPVFLAPSSPDLTNPDLTNPDLTNGTMTLAPGETGKVSLRVQAPTKTAAVAFIEETVQPDVVSQGQSTNAPPGSTQPAALIISTLSAPNAQQGTLYNLQLQAVGGTGNRTWTQTAGALPAGFTLSSSGVISSIGLVTAPLGTYAFTVKVVDSATPVPQEDTQDLTITVTTQPTFLIAQTAAPAGSVGTPYSFTPTVTSGTSPFIWTFYGNLPPGLTPSATTGAITGTPTMAGKFNGYFIAKDATNQYAQLGISITITNPAATFIVTVASDSGTGSLRQAITSANAVPIAQPAVIVFNIVPPASSYTITLASPLPTVTRPLTIDATTQPGYIGQPIVQIDGISAGAGANGFTITGGSSVIRGFAIGGFDGAGIFVQTGGGNRIARNYIGTNLAGTAPYGVDPWNIGGDAIKIQDSAGNIIGGTAGTSPGGACTGDCNVLVSRGALKVAINIAGATSTGNQILGNFIGVNAAGTIGLAGPNSAAIVAFGGSGTVIGDGTPAGRNVISGNNVGADVLGPPGFIRGNYIGTNTSGTAAIVNGFLGANNPNGGISLNGASLWLVEKNLISGNGVGISISNSPQNTIRGNIIGLNAAGNAAIPNLYGVLLTNISTNNMIGGPTSGDRNVISGNTLNGVEFVFAASTVTGNRIIGNYIGTNLAGTAAIPNGSNGVMIREPGNFIGGPLTGEGNVISGNGGNGIEISSANGNIIGGNIIGLNAGGTAAIANAQNGVLVSGNGNFIAIVNVISGNSNHGVLISSGTNNTVAGNLIGLTTGNAPIGNGVDGVLIQTGSSDNIIGGTFPSQRNVISGNLRTGINLEGTSINSVIGNYVGTDQSGTVAVPNACAGMLVNGNGNTIGGTAAGMLNIISGNGNPALCAARAGIALTGSTGTNAVKGNYIGLKANGQPLGNNGHGVSVASASLFYIGGPFPGEGNVISANTGDGISLVGTNTSLITIQGNFIGTDAAGVPGLGLGNLGNGITVGQDVHNMAIGVIPGGSGSGPGGNTIASNSKGIVVAAVAGPDPVSISMLGNTIFSNTNLGIDLGNDGITANDSGDIDAGANNRQNFPVITSASTSGVTGTLNSTVNSLFTIQLFKNSVCDPSGNGEGQMMIASFSATSDLTGNASFAQFGLTLASGEFVTATATDPAGNTSEFSQCKAVVPIVAFSNKATFLSTTGSASATGPLPNLGVIGNSGPTQTVGSVKFSPLPPFPIFVGGLGTTPDWSSVLPGNDIAISGPENFDLDFATPVSAFGLDVHEPTSGCGGACVDSTFQVNLLSAGVPVASFSFNAPDDVAAFIGVQSPVMFDKVQIREIAGSEDDEFFGQVYTNAANPLPTQVKLTASDGGAGNLFGWSVAVSGDAMIVGATGDGATAGAAYVFRKTAGAWSQEAKLVPSDPAIDKFFGYRVSISTDVVAVGVPFDDDAGTDAGAVYIFRRVGGVWTQETKLFALDAAAVDYFGERVSIEGDVLAVGAFGDDDNGSSSGSAYVFRRVGGVWTQEAKLLPSDGAADDYFGIGLSMSGDAVVVGAPGDDDAGAESGSAYVFRRVGGVWIQETKLLPSDGAAGDNFGYSVSISGDAVVITATQDDDAGADSGSAYVFRGVGGVWTQEAKLVPSDAAAGDQLGTKVSLSGNAFVVGALYANNASMETGSSYVFRNVGGVWVQTQKLIAVDAIDGGAFAQTAIDGNTVAVGAFDFSGTTPGAVYVIE